MTTITLNVNTFLDENDGSANQGEGLSLRDAILTANADFNNEYIINLPAGTYNLTIKDVLLPTTDSSANEETVIRSRLATGDLDIIGNITIIGDDPDNTIIDAEDLTKPLPPVVDPGNPIPVEPPVLIPTIGDRLFDVLSTETGGILNNGNLVVKNITIKNGIIAEDNIYTTSNGGAVNIQLNAQATFINSIIADSRVTSGQGGGINNDGTLTLDQTIVSGNNSSDNAGGIYNNGTLTIYDSAIIKNLADAAAPDVIEGGGGGILNENGATLIIVNSTISENKSASGPTQNGPGDGGGGILSRGITRIINSTIVNNFAQVGSGIYSETTSANTVLVNTIVALNTGSPDLDGFFDDRSSYNLIGNGNGALLDGRNNNIVGGRTSPIVDPKLSPLQNNGGPTPTHALLEGSLAIDKGNNSMVDFPLFFPNTPATDQRGSERISNAIVDIGAYEVFVLNTNPPTNTNTNNTTTNTNTNTSDVGVNNSTTSTTTGNTTTNTNTNTSNVGVNNSTTNTTTGNTTTNTNTNTSNVGVNNSTTSTTTGSTTTPSNNTSNTTTTTITTPSNNTSNSTITTTTTSNSSNTSNTTTTTNTTSNSSNTTDDSSPLNKPIYRFNNQDKPGTYLFVDAREALSINANFSQFKSDGFAFNVATQPGDDLIPMYRFQNTENPGTYLYTGEAERQTILNKYDNFSLEGLAFYVYKPDANIGEDIYRFQSLDTPGTYLFVNETEKNQILQNYASDFKLEGVAFEV